MNYLGGELWCADIETTGLLSDLKKQEHPRMHNFCAIESSTGEVNLFCRGGKTGLQDWLRGKVLIVHNGILYDQEAMSLFGYDLSDTKIIDTLLISWYLSPKRKSHGLEEYGNEFDVPKPKIDDWESLTQEDYNNRVTEDCKIQRRLWQQQYAKLKELYGSDEEIDRFIGYLMWKGNELVEQQRNQWKLDVESAEKFEKELGIAVEEKLNDLAKVMPKVPVFAVRKRPAKPFLKSGELSSTGLRWKELTEANGLPFTHTEPIKEQVGEEEPNPQSPIQIKNWLDSLGWVPDKFKSVKNKETGEYRDIPQINVEGGEVCDSIKELFEVCPDLEHLEGLGILKHRWGMVKGFLRDQEDGFMTACAAGFTNTLRQKHSKIVNLPSLRAKYGKEIRGLLQSRDEEHTLLGSDLCSLEDRLRQHFQWKLDPEYVKTQMADDYDPHLLTAMSAGLMTEDEMKFYKWYKENHE